MFAEFEILAVLLFCAMLVELTFFTTALVVLTPFGLEV
jgi:hypothetical protein